MRINRKYVAAYLATVFLVILGVVLSPLIVGVWIKHDINKLVDIINRSTSLNVVIADYEEGYLTSKATLTASLKSAPNTVITINQRIEHGPYIFDPESQQRAFQEGIIYSDITLPEAIQTASSGTGTISIITTLLGSQTFKNNIAIDSRDFQLDKQTLFSLTNGMTGVFMVHEKNDQLFMDIFSISTRMLSLKTPNFNIKLEKLHLDNQTECSGQACKTTNLLSLGNLNETNENGYNVQIAQSNFKNSYEVSPTLLTTDSNFTLNKVVSPYVTMDLIAMNFGLHNFNLPALKKLSTVAPIGIVTLGQDASNPQAQDATVSTFNEMFPAIFTPSSSLIFDASINTMFGNVKANSNIFLAAKTTRPKNMVELAHKIIVKTTITAATALVDHVIQALDDQAQLDAANMMPLAPAPATTLSSASNAKGSIKDVYQNKMSAYNNMVNQLRQLVQSGQVPATVLPAITKMLRAEMPLQNASSSIDGAVINKQITPAAATLLKTLYTNSLTQQKADIKAILLFPNASMKDKLDVLAIQNLITPGAERAVMTLEELALSAELYERSVNDFAAKHLMTATVAEMLKSQYLQNASTNNTDVNPTTAAPAFAATESSSAVTDITSGKLRLQFDAMIKAGYIIQGGDNYVLAMTLRDGELQFNGKNLSAPAPSIPVMPTPQAPATPLPVAAKPVQPMPLAPISIPPVPAASKSP